MNALKLFLLLTVFSLLTFACAVPLVQGRYRVNHSGAYLAHMWLEFELNGTWNSYETDDFKIGESRQLDLPKEATRNKIIVKKAVFIGISIA